MKKIIIADDEHKILMSLEYSFRKSGYEVFIARDGSEVMDLLKTEIPAAILLDIMMPNLDGYETLQQIRAEEQLKDCKIVIVSAKNNPADIQKAYDLGADAYVTKPYSIKKLLQQVDELIT
ncbi:response regulator transcription factor [Edaphocola aurantiacus]|jgi:DNA-binding response OmpR family regulator|uniref:response regulator transcription factor n=1 Tax=Edaphocola aurantiacus TaxID=2601682 RepID=UPI001C94B8D1|nr:response regulator [Edaphocola aurantiacus]